MQTIFKALLAGAILALATGAALAADAAVGTWRLNVEKSTFSPGPAPKKQTRTYAESAQGLTLTLNTVSVADKETISVLTFKVDGKPYPSTGNPDFDTVSVTRVDALTVRSTQMKAGKVVGTGVRAVSADGKTLTFSSKLTDVNGVQHDDVSVYDRQ
jgi:hypothetical protein